MTGSNSSAVVVIGAGIVGISTALWLRRDGHQVTVVDRLPPGEATSHGNAGVLASSSIVPVTVPSLFAKVPKMLADSESPLFLRWRYLPKLLPWLVPYLRNCAPARCAAIAAALTPLVSDSVEQHGALAAGTEAERWLVESDYLFVYANEAGYQSDAFLWRLRRDQGFQWDLLDAKALHDYQLGLGPESAFGVRLAGHGTIRDPGRYVKDLAKELERQGGQIRQAEVRSIAVKDGRVQRVGTDDGDILCDRLVIAGGAWSARLTAMLGMKTPLEAERGYHIELIGANVTPRAPMMIASGKFVATGMDGRLRCAGLIEFGGLEAGPDDAPTRVLQRRAERIFPKLTYEEIRTWMGHRPAPPDSLPFLGEIPGARGAYCAFGHHHVGLTSGPKTGRLVADLIAGRRPNIDLAPYRPDRFS